MILRDNQRRVKMTVLSFLGADGVTNGRGADIGLNYDSYNGRGDGVKISFPAPIPKDAWGHIVINADSFKRLALAMMASNREAAIKAFGAALHAKQDDVITTFSNMRSHARKPPE
jgi:hypothetical protein